MRADLDLIQRTIVFKITMMCALLDSTFDRLIRLHIHDITLLFDHGDSMSKSTRSMTVKT